MTNYKTKETWINLAVERSENGGEKEWSGTFKMNGSVQISRH